MKMKALTMLGAAAAVCLMLAPVEASAQRYRAGVRSAAVGVGAARVGYRAGYRTAFANVGYRGLGYRSYRPFAGYRYGYRPYLGLGVAAAYASTANGVYASYDDSYYYSDPYYSYAAYPTTYIGHGVRTCQRYDLRDVAAPPPALILLMQLSAADRALNSGIISSASCLQWQSLILVRSLRGIRTPTLIA